MKRIGVILLIIFLVWLTGSVILPLVFNVTSRAWSTLLLLYCVISYLIIPWFGKLYNHFKDHKFIPYRTTTTDGFLADPINFAVKGSLEDLNRAMTKAKWHTAEQINLSSIIKMVKSILLKKSYPTAPVSSLYLLGRKQDVAFQQEVDNNPHKRHHVRFWKYTDLSDKNRENIWVGAATYDVGVKLSALSGQFTHRIEGDVDKERDYLAKTLKKANKVKIENFPASGYHYRSKNGGGDAFYTDGKLFLCYLNN